MFWKYKVKISQEMYTDFRIVMWITRFVGMFPLVVKRTSQGLFLKWSPWVATYSYILGLLIIGSGYYGELVDVFSKNQNSIKVGHKGDLIVVLAAFHAFCFVTFCGIFIMPMKTSLFFDYIRCINQVDAIIHTNYKKSDRYKSVTMLVALLAGMFWLDVMDTYWSYTTVGYKLGVLEMLKRNTGLYVVSTLIVVVSYMNRHMAYSLEKRLLRLNELLEAQHKKIKPLKAYETKKLKRRINPCCEDVTIVELRDAYLKLMDAVDLLNDFLGLNTLIMIMSVMFLLTVSSYILILVLEGKRRGRFLELLPRIWIITMHIVRVVLITEPWYACSVQAEIIKRHVCNLSTGPNDRLTKQINVFTMVICLRPYEVTACGFFSVDRTLLTSLIETVTTYLAILLEAYEKGGL